VEAGAGRFEFPEDGEHWTTIWTGGACATSGKYTCAAAFFPGARFNPVAAILPAVELVTTTRLLRLVHPPVAYAIDDPITRNFLLIAMDVVRVADGKVVAVDALRF